MKLFSKFPTIFTRKEFFGVSMIVGVIILSIFVNFSISERKSRDAQRKQDARNIYDALERYHTDFGSYPEAENGKIVACDSGSKNDEGLPILRACEWGNDTLRDVTDLSYPSYLEHIPVDPRSKDGFSYHYISNTRMYQIYTALESSAEAEYDARIVKRDLHCGSRVCSFGLAPGTTPLDKSLEEYENELSKSKGN